MVTMVKVKCIALKHYTMTLTGLESRPLGLETSALTPGGTMTSPGPTQPRLIFPQLCLLPSNSEKELSEKEYALPSSPDFT